MGAPKRCAHGIEVRLAVRLIIAQSRVRPADVHREVTALLPGAWADGVAGPALDREIAGLEIEEQRGRGLERPQLRRLADAALADEDALDAAFLGEALISGDDGEAHSMSPLSRARRKPGLPVLEGACRCEGALERLGPRVELGFRDAVADLDVLGRVVAVGGDAAGDVGQLRLVPLDFFGQIGGDADGPSSKCTTPVSLPAASRSW
jgi:hypothetical protein